VLKIVAITALCYKAFRPFAKIVLNNKFVLAARKSNPSTPTSLQQRLSGITNQGRKSGTAAPSTPATSAEVASSNKHHGDTAAVVSSIHHDVQVVAVPPVNDAKTVLLPIKHAPTVVLDPAVAAVLPEIRRTMLSMQTAHLQSPPRARAEVMAPAVNATTAVAAAEVGTIANMATVEGDTV
jgi:hypothetical protein